MESILTVLIPAASQDLTILATAKTMLNIKDTDTTNDAKLALFIQQASNVCADYCNRVFGQETLSEQFRRGHLGMGFGFHGLGYGGRHGQHSALKLTRYPVASITSITENDTVLVAGTDYEFDPADGIVRRLSSGELSWGGWPGGTIVVVYVAGYLLLDDMPQRIERACLKLVADYYYSSSRDPMLRSRTQPGGLGDETFWVGGPPSMAGGMPTEIAELLDPYCNVHV